MSFLICSAVPATMAANVRFLAGRVGLLVAFGLSFALVEPGSAQNPAASPPFPVLPPIPSSPPPPLSPAPKLAWRSKAPTPAEIKKLTPDVEVWRNGGTSPQRPKPHGNGNPFRRHFSQALVVGNQPVLLRLVFDPSAGGQTVVVKSAPGLSLNPAGETLKIDPTGNCSVTVTLDPDLPQSHLTFYYGGIMTRVPVARTSSEIVAAKERNAGEGHQ